MRDRASWSDAALCAEVQELAAAVERAMAELVAAMGPWNARAAWAADGSLSAVAWLTTNAAMTRGTAMKTCATSRLVHANEQTAMALNVGDVTVAHVEVLAGAVRRREELYPEHEDALLRVAGTVSPDDLVTVARRWRSLADDQLAAVEAASSYEHRFLHVSPTLGGARVDGFLDPVSAATVIGALDALSPPDPASDMAPRSRSVRNADSLVLMAEQAMDGLADGGGANVGIDLLIDVETLLGDGTRDASNARCDLRDYGPVGRVVAERLACDPRIARVVMQGSSRVLDLGRTTRVVGPALRKAVMLRDHHCQGRGCRTPAKWCDVHHVVHWLDGGETTEENLMLLCRRHHVEHHEGGWQVVRGPDGAVTSRRARPGRPRIRRRAPARAGP